MSAFLNIWFDGKPYSVVELAKDGKRALTVLKNDGHAPPLPKYMKPAMTENDYLNRQMEKLRKMRRK